MDWCAALKSTPAPSPRARFLRVTVFVCTALCIIGLDHLTKWLVVQHIPLGEQVPGSGFVTMHHVTNNGAAFSLFPQLHWLYLAAAALITVYLSFLTMKSHGPVWHVLVYGLVVGGALSNGIDRLINGDVVDFIDFHFWPVFNVADIAIVTGILTWMVLIAYHPRSYNAHTQTDDHDHPHAEQAGVPDGRG